VLFILLMLAKEVVSMEVLLVIDVFQKETPRRFAAAAEHA
jgi:hypothetical protein